MNFSGLFFLLLFLLVGCGKKEGVESQIARGRSQFVGYGCNTCHRIGKEGGVLGPDLTTIGFRKSSEWLDLWLKNPPEWKKNTIMPNFYLKEEVRKDLVAYFASLKGEEFRKEEAPWDNPELMQDPVKRGETIFLRAGCVGCHGHSGKGGYPNNNVVGNQIPSLKMVADGYSKEELKDKIRKGVTPVPADAKKPHPMITMPIWGNYLKEDELDTLVEYLYSLRPPVSAEESW